MKNWSLPWFSNGLGATSAICSPYVYDNKWLTSLTHFEFFLNILISRTIQPRPREISVKNANIMYFALIWRPVSLNKKIYDKIKARSQNISLYYGKTSWSGQPTFDSFSEYNIQLNLNLAATFYYAESNQSPKIKEL